MCGCDGVARFLDSWRVNGKARSLPHGPHPLLPFNPNRPCEHHLILLISLVTTHPLLYTWRLLSAQIQPSLRLHRPNAKHTLLATLLARRSRSAMSAIEQPRVLWESAATKLQNSQPASSINTNKDTALTIVVSHASYRRILYGTL